MLQLMLGAQTEHVSALEEANAKAREKPSAAPLSYSAPLRVNPSPAKS